MNNYAIFSDVSVYPKKKIGVGVFLILPASEFNISPDQINRSEINKKIKIKRFEETSSTKLEVQTVLWALSEYRKSPEPTDKIIIYSDSQCVTGLLGRRNRLESNNFFCKGTSRLLNNSALYKEFYTLFDQLKFEVIKMKGHTKSKSRNTVQHIFSFVDKKARKELRQWVEEI